MSITANQRFSESLSVFLRDAPSTAVLMEIRYRPNVGPQELLLKLDVPKSIERGPLSVAEMVIQQCHQWQQGHGQECSFVAQMFDGPGGAVLATTHWRMGSEPESTRPLDGSVESLLAQSQQHIHSVLALHIQGFQTIQQSYKAALDMKDQRIRELEAKLDKLEKEPGKQAAELDHELALAALEEDRATKLLAGVERIVKGLADARKAIGGIGPGEPSPKASGNASPAAASDSSATPAAAPTSAPAAGSSGEPPASATATAAVVES